jgi:hypothetical protein
MPTQTLPSGCCCSFVRQYGYSCYRMSLLTCLKTLSRLRRAYVYQEHYLLGCDIM